MANCCPRPLHTGCIRFCTHTCQGCIQRGEGGLTGIPPPPKKSPVCNPLVCDLGMTTLYLMCDRGMTILYLVCAYKINVFPLLTHWGFREWRIRGRLPTGLWQLFVLILIYQNFRWIKKKLISPTATKNVVENCSLMQ